jgi:hypothetical protein
LALPVLTRTSPSGCHRVFSFRRHPPRVQRGGIVFLRLALLLEALAVGEPRTPSRSAHAPLLGFDVPLQRMQWRAPVFPGVSTLRHVPSLGILTPSTSCFALHRDGLVSSRPTLLGFARSPPSRTSLVSRFETSGLLALAIRPVRRSFERRSSARGPSPGLSPLSWLPGLLTRTSPLHLKALRPVSQTTPFRCFGVFSTRGSGCSRLHEIPALLRFLMRR